MKGTSGSGFWSELSPVEGELMPTSAENEGDGDKFKAFSIGSKMDFFLIRGWAVKLMIGQPVPRACLNVLS